MAELSNTTDERCEEHPSNVPAHLHVAPRDWTARGAIFFWIAVSGAVWIALAASAVWIY